MMRRLKEIPKDAKTVIRRGSHSDSNVFETRAPSTQWSEEQTALLRQKIFVEEVHRKSVYRLLMFCGGCFAAILLYCSLFVPHDPSAPSVHKYGGARYCSITAIFMFIFVLVADVNNMLAQINELKRQVCLAVVFVNTCALITHSCLMTDISPVLLDFVGRPIYPARYLEWTFATPVLIFLVHRLTHNIRFPEAPHQINTELFIMIVSDMIMTITGFFGTYLQYGVLQLICISLSFVAFIPTVYGMSKVLTDTAKYCREKDRSDRTANNLIFLRCVIQILWSAFPTIWLLGAFQLISIENEAMAYCITDMMAKCSFSIMLMNGNYATLDYWDYMHQLKMHQENQRLDTLSSTVALDSKLQRNFFAISAHELRTPLNSIIVFNELLLESDLQRRQQMEYLNASLTSAKALLAVINNVLDYAKYETNEWELDETEFHVFNLLDELVDIISAKAKQEGIQLSVSCSACNNDVLIGDVNRLRQVLLNFLSNSLKFSTPGSEVVVEVNIESETEDEIRLEFSVMDTGIGMTEEAVSKLFHPFYQVIEYNSKYGGSGLGLAISRNIVRKMGGDIDVVSTLGFGSTFSFIVPFKKSNEKSTQFEPFPRKFVQKVQIITKKSIIADQLLSLLRVWGASKVAVDTQISDMNVDYDLIFVDICDADISYSQLKMISICPRAIILSPSHKHKLIPPSRVVSVPLKFSSLHQAISTMKNGARVASPSDSGYTDNMQLRKDFNILIVEDNLINQKVAIAIINRIGYSYDLASDGEEAVEKGLAKNYDIILMDLNLPKLNGLEATKQIREQEGAWHNYIIALTADATDETKRRCYAHGMDDYVVKPISTKKLLGILEARFIVSCTK